LPDDSLLGRMRSARARHEHMHRLADIAVMRIEELRAEMIRTSEEEQTDAELQAQLDEMMAATQEFQEHLLGMARADAEIEAALAEAALESSKLRSDALKQ
jgi:hypothetical protein